MLYKDLRVKELYASIYDPSIIEQMFITGLKIESTQMAVSAMEELITRGDTDIVGRVLDSAFRGGYLKVGTSMAGMIARSLSESRETDLFLHRLGKLLFRAKTDDPVTEFVYGSGTEKMKELLTGTGYAAMERPADLAVALGLQSR